jgi:hypothetical protein
MRVRRIGLAIVVAALAWPAAAQADDASVFAAWTGHKSERRVVFAAYRKAARAWNRRTGPTKSEHQALIDANAQINALMTQIQQETAAQTASTKLGAKAQRLSIQSVDLLVTANVYEIRGDRASIEGHDFTADRWQRRSWRQYKVHLKVSKQATRTWKRAGFKGG